MTGLATSPLRMASAACWVATLASAPRFFARLIFEANRLASSSFSVFWACGGCVLTPGIPGLGCPTGTVTSLTIFLGASIVSICWSIYREEKGKKQNASDLALERNFVNGEKTNIGFGIVVVGILQAESGLLEFLALVGGERLCLVEFESFPWESAPAFDLLTLLEKKNKRLRLSSKSQNGVGVLKIGEELTASSCCLYSSHIFWRSGGTGLPASSKALIRSTEYLSWPLLTNV